MSSSDKGVSPTPAQSREEAIQYYKGLLAQCIANGDPLVPLWKNALITSGTLRITTIRRWVYEGRFPWIKIGRRKYTSNKVLAQWILDGQTNREVFCLDYTKTDSRINWQWKGIYEKARQRKLERRKRLGLPLEDEKPKEEPQPLPPEPEPEVPMKPEIIVEDLAIDDRDLYRDPG